MRKRLAFLLVLLIVFLLSGCSTIPLEKQKLEEYKYVAIQELNIYLETKLANNFYDDAGHNNLVSIVENSIAEIQNAEKKTAIDLIKSEAQRDMDYVETMKIEGEVRGAGAFYSISTVYQMKGLSKHDLMSIIFFKDGIVWLGDSYDSTTWRDSHFAPQHGRPDLSDEISNDIRKDIIEEVYEAQSGHPGGSLSCADILTVLYFNQMNIDPENPKAKERDRFVLSKGHCAPALYATLARKGYFDKELLKGFRKVESNLQGHPDMKKIPGVDMSTGSLGQGLSAAVGMAISSKIEHEGYRVYCLLGDGEIEEGQVWEAAMSASKNKLDNLCAIVDYNTLQIDGNVEEVAGLIDIKEKFESFGFNVIEVNGHDIDALINAFNIAKHQKEMPSVIIAHTIKGKGVSFMEGKAEWHGKAPNQEQYEQAINELKLQHIIG